MNAEKIQDMKHNVLRLKAENQKLKERVGALTVTHLRAMSEAWVMVNTMSKNNGVSAEKWLKENKHFKPQDLPE